MENMERDYKVIVKEASKELSKVEKISIKDVSNCVKLDEAVNSSPNGKIKIDVDYFAILEVHNEKAKDDKDYYNYIIVAKDGEKFVTGSKSFWNSFVDINDEMEGEDFGIEVYSKPSKNYTGKYFLTCSIMA